MAEAAPGAGEQLSPPAPARRRVSSSSTVLHGPSLNEKGMQVSVHTCPQPLQRELRHVFHALDDLSVVEHLVCIATMQKSELNLLAMNEEVDREKDRLLNEFVRWASALVETLRSHGHFADYIDPCSGLPMLSGGNKVYSEVQGMELVLRYSSMDAGMCRVLLHPLWGSNVYPASLFTNAPSELVIKLLS
jgi:hypothetical protein